MDNFPFRLVVITILLLLSASHLTAQNSKKNSFKSYKSKVYSDVGGLLEEAEGLKNNDPSAALSKVTTALEMSIDNMDEFGEGKCYILIGQINEGQQEWKLAFSNFMLAHNKLQKTYSNTKEYRETLRGLGNASMKQGLYDDALRYFKEAINHRSTYEEQMDRKLDISETYYLQGKYDEALGALGEEDKTKKIASGNSSTSVRIQNQRAKIYTRTNKLDQAQGLFDNSLNSSNSLSGTQPSKVVAPSAKNEEYQSNVELKEEISSALVQQQRFDDEIALRNKSIEYNRESKNYEEIPKDKVELSKALVAKGETTSAIKELEEAAAIADTINNPKEQAQAYLSLATIYERKGDQHLALRAYKKYSGAISKIERDNAIKLTEKSELIKKQKDIEELSKTLNIAKRDEEIEQAVVFRQKLIIYGLAFMVLIVSVTSYLIYKNAMASKTANQLLALKSLRSQMNPHFIFNALNSVNHFIAQQDERTANKFLSEFSQLMRLVLENSQQDFISLSKEQEILSLYLKLEQYRFRDKFDYTFDVDESINTESFMLPPMLIQPYVENAVWHGLRYRDTKGQLTVTVKQNLETVVVEVQDNGIGRKKSMELKTANQRRQTSTGLSNIRERLTILNKVYKANFTVVMNDGDHGEGTKVILTIPNNIKYHA